MGRSGERENKRWAGWGGPQRGLKAAAPELWAAGSKLQLPGSGPEAQSCSSRALGRGLGGWGTWLSCPMA